MQNKKTVNLGLVYPELLNPEDVFDNLDGIFVDLEDVLECRVAEDSDLMETARNELQDDWSDSVTVVEVEFTIHVKRIRHLEKTVSVKEI